MSRCPRGVSALDLDFQYLSAVDARQGRVEITGAMMDLKWNTVVLYPAGYFTRDIPVAAEIRLPAGFEFGTALDIASAKDGAIVFAPVPLETLVDSPLLAGRYFTKVDLDPGAPVRVSLDVAADRPNQLKIKPEELAAHRNLVRQAYKLFGAHHYDHYDFLLGVSEHVDGEGLEHHQSSENVTTSKYFSHWDKSAPGRDLLAHEFTHSWNGKFRRPADLWTPTYNVKMQDSLLWVYEGLTQYWGYVLAARSGLWTKAQALDALASDAAVYANRAGRQWKPLADTTNDPITAERRPLAWRSWQRSEDYYEEGMLVWLDADTLIREKSGGRKSLDDFARGFFGIDDGSHVPRTYTFDDVVARLNAVLPYDWAGFLKARVDMLDDAPLGGLTRGGYRLVYADKPSDFDQAGQDLYKYDDFNYSLGLAVNNKGRVTGVAWNGPAFKAGFTVGSEIIAVNGNEYDADDLRDAIADARTDSAPIQMLVKRDDGYRSVGIDYHGGLRYPHLERATGKPMLDALLSPKS